MSEQLLIENGTVIPMNEGREILDNGAVAVQGARIVAVGSTQSLRARYPDARRLDARGKAVLPGLINAHTHVPMSLQKGTTLAIKDGLYRVMWPVERSLTADDCYIGALAGVAEALKGGATTIVDHYFYAEQTARAAVELGVRAVIGHTIMSRLGPITGEGELDAGIRFVSEWKGKHPRITPWLAPHATDTVSREWLIQLREVASQEGIGLHLHVAQSPLERQYVEETYGLSCVEFLDDIGFLGNDVLAAHCIFIDDHEMKLLATSGTHPIYCPMGHALNGKPARAWEMAEQGAPLLLATDCVTGNNVMDLLGELRMAGAAQKQLTRNPEAMPSGRILEMVTVEAARAIGMGDQLGKLAPGYLADIIMVDISGLPTAPNYFPLDNIVYCCNGRDVHTVIVGGEIVVQDGRLLTASEDDLVAQVTARGRKLLQRALAEEEDLKWLWQKGASPPALS